MLDKKGGRVEGGGWRVEGGGWGVEVGVRRGTSPPLLLSPLSPHTQTLGQASPRPILKFFGPKSPEIALPLVMNLHDDTRNLAFQIRASGNVRCWSTRARRRRRRGDAQRGGAPTVPRGDTRHSFGDEGGFSRVRRGGARLGCLSLRFLHVCGGRTSRGRE